MEIGKMIVFLDYTTKKKRLTYSWILVSLDQIDYLIVIDKLWDLAWSIISSQLMQWSDEKNFSIHLSMIKVIKISGYQQRIISIIRHLSVKEIRTDIAIKTN
jgi:hypothetical protein